MRISDWSSDVCSSDLKIARAPDRARERAGGVIGLGDGLGNLEQHRLACMRFGDAKEGFERGDRGGAIGAGRAFVGKGDVEHRWQRVRSEEHTSELQSLMRISYAVFCLKKKKHKQ